MPEKATEKTRPDPGPRLLFITPEISYVLKKLSADAERLRAKAGGLTDVSAFLVHGLSSAEKDIQLAIPHYRNLFKVVNKPPTLASGPASRSGTASTWPKTANFIVVVESTKPAKKIS